MRKSTKERLEFQVNKYNADLKSLYLSLTEFEKSKSYQRCVETKLRIDVIEKIVDDLEYILKNS